MAVNSVLAVSRAVVLPQPDPSGITTFTQLYYPLMPVGQVASLVLGVRNAGPVQFDVRVRVQELTPGGTASFGVHPVQATVAPGQTLALTFTHTSHLPDVVEAEALVYVGHFAPEVVRMRGCGIFPQVSLDLPQCEPTALLANLSSTTEMTPAAAEFPDAAAIEYATATIAAARRREEEHLLIWSASEPKEPGAAVRVVDCLLALRTYTHILHVCCAPADAALPQLAAVARPPPP
jgi:hypothetical protein